MKPVTAASNLWARTQRLLLITVGLVIFGVFLSGIFSYLTHQKTKRAKADGQQILNAHLSDEGVDSLRRLINLNPDAATALSQSFPDALTFPDIIAQIESSLGAIDPNGTVQIQANKPVKISQDLTIPLSIRANTTMQGIFDLLKQIELLPYIIEVSSLQVSLPEGQGGLANSTINLRVYVQDPFTPK